MAVAGEAFRATRRDATTHDYEWLTGPDKGYGFLSGAPVGWGYTRKEHEDPIRGFLEGIDPGTGHLSNE